MIAGASLWKYILKNETYGYDSRYSLKKSSVSVSYS